MQKIDPNTQQVSAEHLTSPAAKFAQAAIPATLTFLYKFLKTDEGVAAVLSGNNFFDIIDVVFNNKRNEAVKRIADYSGYAKETTEKEVNEILAEAVRLIKENMKETTNATDIKNQVAAVERDNILPYLPAALNIGELLGDTTLDDKTNKMEGPISSLMHKIEKGFSSSE